MSLQVDDAVDIYRSLAKIPTVSRAAVANLDSPGHVTVYSEWTQRDLERFEKIKFSRNHVAQLNVVLSTPPTDVSSEILSQESPSGEFRAVLRKIKNKKSEDQHYIEIWNDNKKIHNINVDELEQHGKIYEDGIIGCFEWSHSESHLLYIAEKKGPKAKSFFDKKAAEEEATKGPDSLDRGGEFVYREDWGEQYVGKSQSVLCILDVESGVVSTLDNIPEDICPGQGVWCPDDSGVVFVGWNTEPYRLGFIYCPIRKNALYHFDLKKLECSRLTGDDRSLRSPQFSPDNKKMIYLDNAIGGPHCQCSRLMMCDWSTKGMVPVLEAVEHAPADQFQGIYTYSGLPRRCWAADSKRIVIDNNWRSRAEICVINVETGKVKKISNDSAIGSMRVLDVHKDLIVAVCSSPNQPQYLVIGQLPAEGKEENIKWERLDAAGDTPQFTDLTWRTFTVKPPEKAVNGKYPHIDYEAWVVEPLQEKKDAKLPLVLFIHGGPHSAIATEYALSFAGLCKLGFAIVTVNYRGSIGFGQDGINSLPGNIGTQDVFDVNYALDELLSTGRYDKDKVVVTGGSHGGFLTCHMIGQFPDKFKAAAVRNPVTNVASMLSTTDIPDWTLVEGALQCSAANYASNPETYKTLWNCSPIRYVDQMKTPLLLMIGSNDRRVPPSQSQELRKALQARQVPVRMIEYPDNCHPINKVDAEADAFINMVKWFCEHIQ